MRYKVLVVFFVFIFLLSSVIRLDLPVAGASAQVAYGVNLAQMRPPIDDYAYAFNASVPAQCGVDWLREAAFVDPTYGPNFTALYNQYAPHGYSWLLRLDILGVSSLYGPNWTLQDWDSYVKFVVNDFPNVHVWEVGNEVLSGQAQYNTGYLKESSSLSTAYFNILRDAYQIVKGHNSSDIVIAFGGQDIPDFSALSLYNSGDFEDASYKLAAQVWAEGASQYCDAISIHAYGDNTGGAWLLNETPVYGNIVSTLTLQQLWGGLIDEYESLTDKPIWFTETGEPIDSPPNDPTPPVISNSLAKQAAFLNQSFTFLSSFPFTKAIFWFKLVGQSEYYSNNVLLYTLDDGLFNQDGTLRSATYVFEEFSPGTSLPAPTSTPLPTATLTPTPSSTPSSSLTSSLTPSPTIPEFTPLAIPLALFVLTAVMIFVVSVNKKSAKVLNL
jgi:hypothetical protein